MELETDSVDEALIAYGDVENKPLRKNSLKIVIILMIETNLSVP